MSKATIKRIIQLVIQAQKLASKIGIPNILQPGLVKEMIISDILGHQLITSKRDADACDWENPGRKYEYLSCKEGGSGQLDRMFKEPDEKRAESLARITRNAMIYFAVFDKENQIKVKAIYEITIPVLLTETERQLDRSKNPISHVSFSVSWAAENGKLVYGD